MVRQRVCFIVFGVSFVCLLLLSYVGQHAFMSCGCLEVEKQQQQLSDAGMATRRTAAYTEEQKQVRAYPRKAPMTVPSSLCGTNQANETFLSLLEIQQFVQEYENDAYSIAMKRSFAELGRRLYRHATDTQKMLLTLQIGGMDGVTGDPMNDMLVSPVGDKKVYRNHKQHKVVLDRWVPLVVEPVPDNFQKLKEHYDGLKSGPRGLACHGLQQWAISYEVETNTTATSCEFCRFNQNSTDPACTGQPEWMRNQVGTLDCAYSRKRVFGKNFDACVVQDHLPCGTISQLLHNLGLPIDAPIGILQIDVEGYEATILPSLLNEMPDDNLPIVIHFEHKVLRHLDSLDRGGYRAKEITTLLRQKNYLLYDQGQDMLALRVLPNGLEMDQVS